MTVLLCSHACVLYHYIIASLNRDTPAVQDLGVSVVSPAGAVAAFEGTTSALHKMQMSCMSHRHIYKYIDIKEDDI